MFRVLSRRWSNLSFFKTLLSRTLPRKASGKWAKAGVELDRCYCTYDPFGYEHPSTNSVVRATIYKRLKHAAPLQRKAEMCLVHMQFWAFRTPKIEILAAEFAPQAVTHLGLNWLQLTTLWSSWATDTLPGRATLSSKLNNQGLCHQLPQSSWDEKCNIVYKVFVLAGCHPKRCSNRPMDPLPVPGLLVQ